MKAKKLLFLMAILMVFSATSVMAQRGTCNSGADPLQYMYTNVDGNETQDTSTALSGTINGVSPGATVKVGSALPYINWGEVTSYSIAVSSDNGETPITIDNSNIGSYGENWQPTIPAAFFTAGAVTTVAMTVTPDASNPWNNCTTPWTYTWTFNVATVCVPVNNHNAYSNNGTSWTDHPTGVTTINIYDIPLNTNIALGVDNPKSTIVYNGCGYTDETVVSADFWFTPFTAAGSCTITGVYYNNCDEEITYTFNLTTEPEPTAGIEEFELNNFKAYPNPANNVLNVKYNGEANISIFNVIGKEIQSTNVNQEKTINISNLTTGVYFLKISDGRATAIRKFIKK